MTTGTQRARPDPDALVPLDGDFVHMVEGTPVKELSDAELARYQRLFAAQSQPLLEQQAAAVAALVRNEIILNVLTFEVNRRKTSLVVPH